MKNNEKRFINIQLFADEPTGATTPQPTGTDTRDFEKEFKALKEKYDSLNENYMKKSEAFDKVSSEVADFKRQQRDNMSKEQQQAEEIKEFEARMAQLESENKAYKLEKGLLSEGFTADECNKLISNNFDGKVIMEIIKARIEDNTKSVKAGLIKATTPADPLGNGTTSDPKGKKSGFALFQEEMEAQSKNGKVEL